MKTFKQLMKSTKCPKNLLNNNLKFNKYSSYGFIKLQINDNRIADNHKSTANPIKIKQHKIKHNYLPNNKHMVYHIRKYNKPFINKYNCPPNNKHMACKIRKYSSDNNNIYDKMVNVYFIIGCGVSAVIMLILTVGSIYDAIDCRHKYHPIVMFLMFILVMLLGTIFAALCGMFWPIGALVLAINCTN